MCGICGWVGSPEGASQQVAERMSAAIAHRGPEGHGDDALPAGRGWFSHRRLKILDLTENAHQPMVGGDGATWLLFNGEVYNFAALRRELAALGHSFRSSGDTEVVLRAYEQWGEDMLPRLDGMFAIAVWDARRERLLLARDRTGKKPLFYRAHGGTLTFGSEIKALARAPWVPLAPRRDRLAQLLAFGYAPWPDTMYEGVRQVPPAGALTFAPGDPEPAVRNYWSALPEEPPRRPPASLPDEVRELLDAATARRMVADVPVGCLLSGGVDSSVVAALMSRHATEPVLTFSIGFPDEHTFDERRWARLVAEHLGTRHTEFEVRADAVALLDRLVWLHDGPFADSSAVPTSLVCGLAREHVTVALTGDGGDEVFGGYERFTAARLARLFPAWAAGPARTLVRALPERAAAYATPRRRIERFAAEAGRPPADRYLGWVSVFTEESVEALLGPQDDVAAAFRAEYAAAAARGLPELDRILYANLRTYLPDDLHVKTDRSSMGHSLELRTPFLDTALIERLARVPAAHKVGVRQVKPLLRRACESLLPPEIFARRKHGFGVPVDAWFNGPLRELAEDELVAGGARIHDFLDAGAVRALWREQREGGGRHGPRLWTLLTAERWLRDLERPEPLLEPRAPALTDAEAR